MRHSTMDLTLRYYTHLTLENKAEALDRLPEIGLPTDGDEIAASRRLGSPSVISVKQREKVDTETDTNGVHLMSIWSHRVSLSRKQQRQFICGFRRGKENRNPLIYQGVAIRVILGIPMGIRNPSLQTENLSSRPD